MSDLGDWIWAGIGGYLGVIGQALVALVTILLILALVATWIAIDVLWRSRND